MKVRLETLDDCDRELSRVQALEAKALRDCATARLNFLSMRRTRAVSRRIELQHADMFQALGQEFAR